MASNNFSFSVQDAKSFLQELRKCQENLRQEKSQLLNQWSNLKSSWEDKQRNDFEEIFDKILSTYNNAEQANDKHIKFVEDMIEKQEKISSQVGDLPNL